MKAWSHHNKLDGKDEWLTPPSIIHALGPFDLDPCSPVKRPWATAAFHLTVEDDGLEKEWSGRVWCNPPYNQVRQWMSKCKSHGNCIALIYARTETKTWFESIWDDADAVVFLKGRLTFLHVDGSKPKLNSGGPSALIAYGKENVDALERALASGAIEGKLIRLP